jgi:hypothetical protein
MTELHKIIQISMNWKGLLRFRFYCEAPNGERQYLHNTVKLGDIDFCGKKEIVYEYGSKWLVRVLIMSSCQSAKDEFPRFAAGEGAPPPEQVEGPRHFHKLLAALETAGNKERQFALHELGTDFNPGTFELDKLNRIIREELGK